MVSYSSHQDNEDDQVGYEFDFKRLQQDDKSGHIGRKIGLADNDDDDTDNDNSAESAESAGRRGSTPALQHSQHSQCFSTARPRL